MTITFFKPVEFTATVHHLDTLDRCLARTESITAKLEADLAACRFPVVRCFDCKRLQAPSGQWVVATPAHNEITDSVCPTCKARVLRHYAGRKAA